MYLSLGKSAFQKMENWNSENLIKTVVYEDFWRPFAENSKKVPRKALGFSVKPDALSRHPRKSLFQWENSNLRHRKRLFKKPYKHCRLWRVLRPFSRKVTKREPKTITKIAFCEWDLAMSETLCFAEENKGFWDSTWALKHQMEPGRIPDPATYFFWTTYFLLDHLFFWTGPKIFWVCRKTHHKPLQL